MNAVNRANINTSSILNIDARFGDDVGHRFYPPISFGNTVTENYILKIDD